MGRYRRKRMHVNDKTQKKKYRTRRRTKDLDQIQDDMLPENASRLTNQPVDPDLPGEGRYYCLHCSRYFIDGETMTKHFRSKLHKRRLKALSEPVYTQKEAEMAAGIGSYILPPPPLEAKMKSTVEKKTMDLDISAHELSMRIDGLGMGTNTGIKGIDVEFKSLQM